MASLVCLFVACHIGSVVAVAKIELTVGVSVVASLLIARIEFPVALIAAFLLSQLTSNCASVCSVNLVFNCYSLLNPIARIRAYRPLQTILKTSLQITALSPPAKSREIPSIRLFYTIELKRAFVDRRLERVSSDFSERFTSAFYDRTAYLHRFTLFAAIVLNCIYLSPDPNTVALMQAIYYITAQMQFSLASQSNQLNAQMQSILTAQFNTIASQISSLTDRLNRIKQYQLAQSYQSQRLLQSQISPQNQQSKLYFISMNQRSTFSFAPKTLTTIKLSGRSLNTISFHIFHKPPLSVKWQSANSFELIAHN